VNIRPVQSSELRNLHHIAKSTFVEAFAVQNTASDMQKYVAEFLSYEKIESEFQNPESQFYFAEADGVLLGYLKINSGKAQTESFLENALEVERIYVSSPFQGKGVGQLLFDYAVEKGRSEEFDWIWLGVWEKNLRAIKFYKRNGFVEFNQHQFLLGGDLQVDLLLKFNLKLKQ
jgi:ribosomal protein S18 acetylase RimI-like enzyme